MRLENGVLRMGQVFTAKATVKISYWNDKTFEKNYLLRPLSEVETFIQTHKHLPDVPPFVMDILVLCLPSSLLKVVVSSEFFLTLLSLYYILRIKPQKAP